MKAALLLAMACTAAVSVHAHGFEERYDLPVPLGYVVAAACAAVFLTFLIAVLLVRQPAAAVVQPAGPGSHQTRSEARGLDWGWGAGLVRGVCWLLFAVTVVSALCGTADPLMNLAPTLVWIVWWVGLSFAVLLLGNFWPVLDPWRSTFEALDFIARKLGCPRGLSASLGWPARLGMWPAVFLLLGWCWLEVVYSIASSPAKLGFAALAWSAVSLTGMVCCGRDVWQKNGDVFAIYFAALGQLAPLQFDPQRRVLVWCPPGQRLIDRAPGPVAGQVGFVMAMLSSVLFDGLHGGSAWTIFERELRKTAVQWMDVNGYFAGTVGLVLVWLAFLAAYLVTCRLTAFVMVLSPARGRPGWHVAACFAPTLIPIAAAYNVAHNFSNVLIQGQTVFQLLSDPLGRQWDLFGTARFYPDIALVDARLTWYVAVGSIVAGHALSVWLAHHLALRLKLSPCRTVLATLPLTCLMLAYTAVSLLVIGEPMVVYSVSP